MNSSLRLSRKSSLPQADPEQLQLLVGGRRVVQEAGDGFAGGSRGAEARDPGEAVRMVQADGQRLAAAHAQARNRAVRGVGLHAVVRLDERHDVLQQVALEGRRYCSEGRRAPIDAPRGRPSSRRPWAWPCPGRSGCRESNGPCRARPRWPGCRRCRAGDRASESGRPPVCRSPAAYRRPARAGGRATWTSRCAGARRRAGHPENRASSGGWPGMCRMLVRGSRIGLIAGLPGRSSAGRPPGSCTPRRPARSDPR